MFGVPTIEPIAQISEIYVILQVFSVFQCFLGPVGDPI